MSSETARAPEEPKSGSVGVTLSPHAYAIPRNRL